MKRAIVAAVLVFAAGLVAIVASQSGEPPRTDAPRGDRQLEHAAPTLIGADHETDPDLLWWLVVEVEGPDTRDALAGADVEIELWTEDSPTYTRATDAEGRVRLGPYSSPFLEDGLLLRVSSRTLEASSGFVDASPAGDGVRELRATARLVRSAVVTGRVLLPPGVPVEAARLWMRGVGGPLIDHYGDLNGCETVPLTRDGRFRQLIGDPQSLEWIVAVAHEGRRWFGRGVSGTSRDEHLELEVADLRPGDLALTRMHVRTPSGEAVPANFWAVWITGDRVSYDVGTDSDEEHFLWFQWQPDGEFYVQVEHSESDAFGHVALGPLSMRLTDIEVTLPRERVLRGAVRTEDGKPVVGAKVVARVVQPASSGRDLGWMDEGAVTDASGRYAIRGLGRLPYVVSARVESDLGTTRPTEVTAEQEACDVVVYPWMSARVRVLDAGGAPVEGARVIVDLPPWGVTLDPDALPLADWSVPGEFEDVARHVQSSEDGAVEINRLDVARRYRLIVRAPAIRPDLGDVELQGWRPQDTTLTLVQGAVISGKVLGSDDQPAGRLPVYARSVDGSDGGGRRYRLHGGGEVFEEASGWAGEDGAFAIGPLPAGRYEIHVPGGTAKVVAATGSKDVVLRLARRLEEPYSLRFRVNPWRFEDRGAWAVLSVGDDLHKRAQVDPGGTLQFDDLPNFDRYALWIGGLAGGRYVWLRDLEPPSDDAWDALAVEPKAGGTIRGRVLPPPGVQLDTWSVAPVGPALEQRHRGGVLGGVPCEQDAQRLTFACVGVPGGTWVIRVEGTSGGKTYRGEAKGAPGDEVTVRLK